MRPPSTKAIALCLVGATSWSVVALWLTVVTVSELRSPVMPPMRTQDIAFVVAVLSWSLSLLVAVAHLFSPVRTQRWIVVYAGGTVAAFCLVVGYHLFASSLTPMERERSGGTLEVVSLLVLLGVMAVAPMGTFWIRNAKKDAP